MYTSLKARSLKAPSSSNRRIVEVGIEVGLEVGIAEDQFVCY
jgi:hypothetical protein